MKHVSFRQTPSPQEVMMPRKVYTGCLFLSFIIQSSVVWLQLCESNRISSRSWPPPAGFLNRKKHHILLSPKDFEVRCAARKREMA